MSVAEVLQQSRRPDGTLRPAVRVRKGYVPPEEQTKYSEKWKSEDDGAVGIPGAGGDPASALAKPMTKAAAKNKRRIERDRILKMGKDGAGSTEGGDSLASVDAPLGGSDAGSLSSSTVGSRPPVAAGAAPAASEGGSEVVEVEKKIKTLRKRLRQIEELEEKLMSGALLNADQTAKVASKERIEGAPTPRAPPRAQTPRAPSAVALVLAWRPRLASGAARSRVL
jgi:partner of Y14 and mago protein